MFLRADAAAPLGLWRFCAPPRAGEKPATCVSGGAAAFMAGTSNESECEEASYAQKSIDHVVKTSNRPVSRRRRVSAPVLARSRA